MDWPDCDVEHPAPYSDGNTYVTNHGDRANSNFVPCEGPTRFDRHYHVLQGYGIIQPNTYSPDGATTYVTTLPDDAGCSVFAVEVTTGDILWKRCDLGEQAMAGSVDVDGDGNLFLTTETGVHSLGPGGSTRWSTSITDASEVPRAYGVKLTGDGHVATQYADGVVYLLDRGDGTVLAEYDVAAELGYVAPEATNVPVSVLPDYVIDRLMRFYRFASEDELEEGVGAIMGASGALVANTVAIGDDTLFAVGGGPDQKTGALVALAIGEGPSLSLAWTAHLPAGTGSSPALSRDGRRLAIGDGADEIHFFDVEACAANDDADEEASVCAPTWRYTYSGGPLRGTVAMDDDHDVYFWSMGPDRAAEAWRIRDAGDHAEEVWVADYGEDAMITSVLTVLENVVYVDLGEIVPEAEIGDFTIPIETTNWATALDRETGEILHQVEVPDDSLTELQMAPDGSLFLTCLPVLTAITFDEKAPDPIGGLQRFVPVP